jgi:hypothetical protein
MRRSRWVCKIEQVPCGRACTKSAQSPTINWNDVVSLVTLDDLVIGEPGKVYSTAPRIALGADSKRYYVKGCNDVAAFSEVVGCSLAALMGLRVPPAAVCEFDGDLYAGVEEVPNMQRNIKPWLGKMGIHQ